MNPIPQATPDFATEPKVALKGITILKIALTVGGGGVALFGLTYLFGSVLMSGAAYACR
jgi:hypothetical protein